MIIVAIDPGVATGVCVWDNTARVMARDYTLDQFEAAKLMQYLFEKPAQETVCVIEKYTITESTIRKTRQYASLELIGVARYFVEKSGCGWKMQTPTDAKRFMTDKKLKALGWWDPVDHVRDAYRHLGLYLSKELKDREVMLAGIEA